MEESFKVRVIHELKLFFLYTLFFGFFFLVFGVYKRLILGEYAVDYIQGGYSFIEAAILSKVILMGQRFKVGERFKDRPLIYPVIYKTITFSFLALFFAILEHFLFGFLRGKSATLIYEELMARSLDQILAGIVVMSFVFFLFFAFFEVSKLIGDKKLFNLFFKRTSS